MLLLTNELIKGDGTKIIIGLLHEKELYNWLVLSHNHKVGTISKGILHAASMKKEEETPTYPQAQKIRK